MSLLALLAFSFISPKPSNRVLVWQKWIAPGLTYEMEWQPAAPRLIHILKLKLSSGSVKAMPDLGRPKMFLDNPADGRLPVSKMVEADQGLAGVNGDFFPFRGNPLNIMVRNGQIFSFPYQPSSFPNSRRPFFEWNQTGAKIGFARTEAFVTPSGGLPIALNGFNELAAAGMVVLSNDVAGLAEAHRGEANSYAVIKITGGSWTPNGNLSGEVRSTGTNLTKMPIEPGDAVLVGQTIAAAKVNTLSKGDRVSITFKTVGVDTENFPNVIGGANLLVQDGKIVTKYLEARLTDSFIRDQDPRTAIGINKQNELVLVVVDGRTSESVGASLPEMAKIMKALGCVQAINLDGGGSSTFDLLGQTMNTPSDGKEREVANGIVIYGNRQEASDESLSIEGLSVKNIGSTVHLEVRDTKSHQTLPNSEVLWSASGSGWIDQGGNLHLRRTGKVMVFALVHGQKIDDLITIPDSN